MSSVNRTPAHGGLYTSKDARFEFLFLEAFYGLLEQRGLEPSDSDELSMRKSVSSVYADTGNIRLDYKVLRDAVEQIFAHPPTTAKLSRGSSERSP